MSRTKSAGHRSNRRNIRSGLIVLIFVLDVVTGQRAQTFAQSPSPSPVQSATPVIRVPDSAAPDQVEVVRVDIDLVNTPVSVTDRRGRYVPGLRPEDFRVYENGVEQRIAHFAAVEKPFTVALLLDTSASTQIRLADIKSAAIAFIDQLRPDDRVMVICFNDNIQTVTEPTADRKALREAVLSARGGSGTRLFDAVDFALNEKLSRIEGRKAIVLLTDGIDHVSSSATSTSTIHHAEEADTLIYSVQYDTFLEETAVALRGMEVVRKTSTLYPPGLGPDDYAKAKTYLTDLARKSGGQFFGSPDLRSIRHSFAQIAEELRSLYILGYYTEEAAANELPRRINVRVSRLNLIVTARRSYLRKARVGGRH